MIKIFNDDCLVGMERLEDESVDMILTDLPFGSTNCAWDKKLPLKPLWSQFKRVLKKARACVLFAQMRFAAELVTSAQIKFRYKWVWEKNIGAGFFNAKKMPLRCHEDILVFYQRLPTYNPQFTQGEPYRKEVKRRNWQGTGVYNYSTPRTAGSNDGEHYYPRDVLSYATVLGSSERRYHSTQKPVDLLAYLIRTYTHEGEVVLDATMGSGSTGVACINEGRDFIGFELDEEIYSVARERLEQAEISHLNFYGGESV